MRMHSLHNDTLLPDDFFMIDGGFLIIKVPVAGT